MAAHLCLLVDFPGNGGQLLHVGHVGGQCLVAPLHPDPNQLQGGYCISCGRARECPSYQWCRLNTCRSHQRSTLSHLDPIGNSIYTMAAAVMWALVTQ